MSEPPEKKSPWSKYYAERGVSRAPRAESARPLFQRDDEAGPKSAGGAGTTAPALSAELTAAIAAVTAATEGTTAAPFITAMHREMFERERRRSERQRMIKIGAIIVAVAVAGPVVGTLVFNREPPEQLLEAQAAKVAADVLALHSSPKQPLMTASAVVRPLAPVGLGHLRYEIVVTMHLRLPLYAFAQSNGTEAYRMLQRSLAEAKDRATKLRLFRPPAVAPEMPEMPVLLQLAHRTGEPVVVSVPLEARRFGWRWRLQPAETGGRKPSRLLDGLPLDSYADMPTLIFGSPETLADVRRRTKAARDYVTAVNKEARERLVADAPAQEARAIETPLPPPAGRFDPAAPALPDPNAPAVPAGPKPPGLFDPNAPAVPRPKQLASPR